MNENTKKGDFVTSLLEKFPIPGVTPEQFKNRLKMLAKKKAAERRAAKGGPTLK